MSNTPVTHVWIDGPRKVVVNLQNHNVNNQTLPIYHVIDPEDFNPPGTRWAINKIWYQVAGMRIGLYWDVVNDVEATHLYIYHSNSDSMDYSAYGGIADNSGNSAGTLTIVAETLSGFGIADEAVVSTPASYDITLELIKKFDGPSDLEL